MFHRHKKEDRVKVEFTISVISLRDLQKTSVGNSVFIELKRGNKSKNHRYTKEVSCTSTSEVTFDEKFKFEVTLYHSKDKDNKAIYVPKKILSFAAKEKKEKKKGTILGTVEIDLSQYGDSGKIRTELLPMKNEKSKSKSRPPNLAIKIESQWIKISDQKLVKKGADTAGKNTASEKTIKIGEDEFALQPDDVTDSHASSEDTHIEFSDEDDDPFKDDEDEEEPVKKHVKSKETPSKSKASKHKKSSKADFTGSPPLPKGPVYNPKHKVSGRSGKTGKSRGFKASHTERLKAPDPNSFIGILHSGCVSLTASQLNQCKLKRSLSDSMLRINAGKMVHVIVEGVPAAADSQIIREQYEAEMGDLKTDKQRLEKKVQNLQSKIEQLQQQVPEKKQKDSGKKAASTGEIEKAELEDMKKDKQRLEMKVERLTKELSTMKEALAAEEKRKMEEAKSRKNSNKGNMLKLENDYLALKKEHSEKLVKLQKLEDSGLVAEELLRSIVNSIRKNIAKYTTKESEMVVNMYYLSYTCTLFKTLKEELPPSVELDRAALNRETLIDNVDDVKAPLERFFHQLLAIAFDAYSTVLRTIFQTFDNILTSFVLEQKGSMSTFVNTLVELNNHMKFALVSEAIMERVLRQLYIYLDAQLFNALLKKPALFTCKTGFQLKMAVSQVEAAAGKVNKLLLKISSDGLCYMKEAANLLVMDKNIFEDETTVAQVFTHLSSVQINYILNYFKPDELAPDPISESVKQQVAERAEKCKTQTLELNGTHIKKINLTLVPT